MSSKDANLVIVTPDIHGPIRNGGIGTAFSSLAYHLKSMNFSVTILYALGKYSEAEPVEHWVKEYANAGIRFVPIPDVQNLSQLETPYLRVASWKVDRWLRQNAEAYAAVIFPEWMGLAYYALLAKKQGLAYQGIKFIVNTHSPEAWARDGNRNLPDGLDDIDRDFMERQSVALADAVVSPSRYLLHWMRDHAWNVPGGAQVIPNLMEIRASSSQISVLEHGSIERLVFFGRLEIRKGLRLFCDAIDRLPKPARQRLKGITFLGKPVSNGGFDSIKYIKRRCQRWGVPVEIVSNKNRDQALEFLARAQNLCVMPSLVENSPYTVLECLERRIRFLASRVGGIPELIVKEDLADCLFSPAPGELAKMIENTLENGIAPARAAQSQEQVAQKWQDFLTDLLHRSTAMKTAPARDLAEMRPLVSICLVHYERPLLLARAIASLRQQTYQNFEIVLVDDGSLSEQATAYLDSLESEFAANGWQLLRQVNSYLGAARNRAAAHARGEYLLFMDDDNIAMPRELETFLRAIVTSGADVLTCPSAPFSGDHPPEFPDRLWLPLGGSAGSGLFRNAFGDANAFWKASVFHALGGFTEDYGVGHEDWELFAHAVLSGYRLELVPEPLFWYHLNPRGMLQSGDSRANYARSVRPYLRHDPSGLGMAAAYAVCLQQICQLKGLVVTQGRSSLTAKLKILSKYAFNPQMQTRLRGSLRQYGIVGTVRKVRYYLQRRSF